jgi:beta-glucosidase
VDVTNTGAVRGDEVAQFYIHQTVSSVTRAVKELRGFQRISLNPGETKTVEFTLGPNELSYLNRDMKRVVEPGAFEVMAGGNSVGLITATLNVVNR